MWEQLKGGGGGSIAPLGLPSRSSSLPLKSPSPRIAFFSVFLWFPSPSVMVALSVLVALGLGHTYQPERPGNNEGDAFVPVPLCTYQAERWVSITRRTQVNLPG